MKPRESATTRLSKHRTLFAIAATALFLGGGFLWARFIPDYNPSIQVSIENGGEKPMRSVTLHVTGATFPMGDVPPGATVNAKVRSKGESHLEIEYADAAGQTHRLNAGGYFESGYRGTIQISIRDGVIENNDQQIRLY
jgi:hypothetical protein